jgi:Cu2+-exporting ATPase
MAIAQTIHGEGLEVFYARRAQSSDKPSAYLASDQIPTKLLPYDDPSLLGRFTRPVGDEGDLETTLRLEKIRCAACVWLCEQHLRRNLNCCQFRSTTKESFSIVNHCSNMG